MAVMRIALAYGRGSIDLELPDQRLGAGARVELLEKHPVPAIPDSDAALRKALEAPIDSAPLRELARGRGVVIVADADEPGRRGAAALATVLRAYCPSVRVVEPPDGGKDARAWRRAGATRADVQDVIEQADVKHVDVQVKAWTPKKAS